ncbi:dethiobiotin synthase [Synechococcus sp. M16CYN]|uniref:dethiobiotin synthase n=1 Tax=Synechococcus sp. M16CYN TaxID=3103139 RepID=UPI003243BB19
MSLRLVVCGTDTDVGKTVVSAWLVQGLRATYWKPVQSGLEGGGDRERVRNLLDLPSNRLLPEAFAFSQPVSPHWAAELDQTPLVPEQLMLPKCDGPLVVETAGGLMVPLTRHLLQIDQLKRWGLPIILVARSGLGTLNHTLLSLEALRQRNLIVLGLILNGAFHHDNPATLEEFGGVPVLAQLPPLQPLTAQTLKQHWYNQRFNSRFQTMLNQIYC